MADELVVVLAGRQIGTLAQGKGGVLTLTYSEDWSTAATAMPVSLSMPTGRRSHTGAVVRSYCEGLLPDSEQVLERWARDFQVSARNPFALLRYVGEDCAGAVQFVRPERVDDLLARRGSVAPISVEQIASGCVRCEAIPQRGTSRALASSVWPVLRPRRLCTGTMRREVGAIRRGPCRPRTSSNLPSWASTITISTSTSA